MGAQAFDLADRLQTPIFVMLDLDIGMNHRLCKPLAWDDTRAYDRGKVMTAEELEAGKEFGRYLDVDGDGIPYRTYPGTHPTKGSFFTRGTSRDRYARYTEEGAPYVDNMQRLIRKFDTAKDLVPRPLQANAAKPTKYGVIYYGSTSPAMDEAIAMIEARGHSRRPHARARLPVPFQRQQLRRRPRLHLRGRAEPRRAIAFADRQRMRHRPGAAGADHCIMTARRSPPASSPRRSATISTS